VERFVWVPPREVGESANVTRLDRLESPERFEEIGAAVA
jgi:hypothetical protein